MPAKKKLPPLEVGQAYEAADFESFEYSGAALTGSKAILQAGADDLLPVKAS